MDDTLKVEFPLGTGTVIMTEPTDGQLFAISMLRKPGPKSTGAEKHRFTERLIRFLENLAGPEQWASVEDDMLSNVLSPQDLLSLFEDVTRFDWNAHRAKTSVVPEAEPDQDETPARPAPRVVSGG